VQGAELDGSLATLNFREFFLCELRRIPQTAKFVHEGLRDPGIYVAMTINMLMVMRSKIVLIRVTMVIVYLSGTPPGFSLSARFLAGPRPSGGT